jgi:hypothetical protein
MGIFCLFAKALIVVMYVGGRRHGLDSHFPTASCQITASIPVLSHFAPVRSHYNLFVEFGGAFGISFPSSSAAAAPAAGSGSARNFSNDFASSDQSGGSYQSGPVATYQPMPAPAASSGYQGISDAKATF